MKKVPLTTFKNFSTEKFLGSLTDFYYEKVEADVAVNGNRQQLKYPAGVPDKRLEFFETLNKYGGQEIYQKYRKKESLSTQIKNSLPAPVYRLLRNIEAKIR